MKKLFRLKDYKDKSCVMHCKTREQANIFCAFMDKLGKKWCGGESYLTKTNWEDWKINTCYNFNLGKYASIIYYTGDCEILEFSDFSFGDSPKDLLEETMVVITRNGNRYIYMHEKLMNQDTKEFLSIGEFDDNLLNMYGSNNRDIMRICESNARTLDIYFKDAQLKTIWERSEVVEMTIDEIKKKLNISCEFKIKE